MDLALRDGQSGGIRLEDLVERCGGGDREAFRALYDAESPRLYGLALRITGQAPLAADAVHDAFLQVWQRAVRFDRRRGSATAWLTGLVRYRAIDLLRSRAREADEEALPEQRDPGPGALDALLETAAGRALQKCLLALEERQRQAIVLAFVHGKTHAELADQLKVPLGTVKSWIRRGLLALKACLES
jgi:RNA polymerase sigma-70 factor, ECF subfamily